MLLPSQQAASGKQIWEQLGKVDIWAQLCRDRGLGSRPRNGVQVLSYDCVHLGGSALSVCVSVCVNPWGLYMGVSGEHVSLVECFSVSPYESAGVDASECIHHQE